MLFTAVVVFNGVNAEPGALPPPCCIVSLALCATLLLSIADDSLEAGSSVTAHIRLTLSGDILTKLATLLDYQSTSYASTQCYIAEVSVWKHDIMAKAWRYQSGRSTRYIECLTAVCIY